MSAALKKLAREIKEAHQAVETAMRESLRQARRAGELLIQVKEQLPHGEFGPWIEAHCGFGWRTANLYMRITREWETLLAVNSQRIANLTLGEAMMLLTRIDAGAVAEEAAGLIALGVLDADGLDGLSSREASIVVRELRSAYDEVVEDKGNDKRLTAGGFRMTPAGLLLLARKALTDVRAGMIGVARFRNRIRPDLQHWSLRRGISLPKWSGQQSTSDPFLSLAHRLFESASAVVLQVECGERLASGLNHRMRMASHDLHEVLRRLEEALKKRESNDKSVTPEVNISHSETRTLVGSSDARIG